MQLYTYQNKLLLVNGKLAANQNCCCDSCVCTCNKCVQYNVMLYGNIDSDPVPSPEPLTLLADFFNKCEADPDAKFGCYDFEYIPEGEPANIGMGTADYPGCLPSNPSYLCMTNDDFNYSPWFISTANVPCVRLVCDNNKTYTLEVCIFNTCCGMDSCAGRLTRKVYSVNLGEDNCPISIGSEISSDVTDWIENLAGWIPATLDLDGGNEMFQYCNQECWNNDPFNFIIGTIENGICVPPYQNCCKCISEEDYYFTPIAVDFETEQEALNYYNNNVLNQLDPYKALQEERGFCDVYYEQLLPQGNDPPVAPEIVGGQPTGAWVPNWSFVFHKSCCGDVEPIFDFNEIGEVIIVGYTCSGDGPNVECVPCQQGDCQQPCCKGPCDPEQGCENPIP